MPKYFVDLHIHIGATSQNKPVKITASRKLTFFDIIKECHEKKGIDIIGIVDCAAPGVLADIRNLIYSGVLKELEGGGWRYQDKVTILPGVEVESKEATGGRGHFVSYFPGLKELERYSCFLKQNIKNLNLSTQQSYLPAKQLLETTLELGGLFFPAHVFTPFKSLYGSCSNSIETIFQELAREIKVIELGLSADTYLADKIPELRDVTFISNSDAHSLEKIGREYNYIAMLEPTFQGLQKAIENQRGGIVANFGLDPKLGKYHRNFCENCQQTIERADRCPICHGNNIVKGVLDRINEITQEASKSPEHRPPYFHQVPLSFIPKIGPKTIDKLLKEFGTEMQVLHNVPLEDLKRIVGAEIAELILLSRQGKLTVKSGGGGIYGKVLG